MEKDSINLTNNNIVQPSVLLEKNLKTLLTQAKMPGNMIALYYK